MTGATPTGPSDIDRGGTSNAGKNDGRPQSYFPSNGGASELPDFALYQLLQEADNKKFKLSVSAAQGGGWGTKRLTRPLAPYDAVRK